MALFVVFSFLFSSSLLNHAVAQDYNETGKFCNTYRYELANCDKRIEMASVFIVFFFLIIFIPLHGSKVETGCSYEKCFNSLKFYFYYYFFNVPCLC